MNELLIIKPYHKVQISTILQKLKRNIMYYIKINNLLNKQKFIY